MIQNLAKKRTGFTLVELLVVIAIIGLLSTIVLVSFGPVRNQARDTAIKANLSQMRLAAEIKYVNDATYVTTTSRADYSAAKAAAEAASPGTVTEHFSAGAYCFQIQLATSGSWCIDSTGYIGTTANCDAVGYDCAS
jgi:prepilin-type N-terminal cleavage/methylation domain-containing protein